MEGFGACCRQRKQAAFFGHHGSPPKWYGKEPQTHLPSNLFHQDPSWCSHVLGWYSGPRGYELHLLCASEVCHFAIFSSCAVAYFGRHSDMSWS